MTQGSFEVPLDMREGMISHAKMFGELKALISGLPDLRVDPDEDGYRAVVEWRVNSEINEDGDGQIYFTASMPSDATIGGHPIEDAPWRHIKEHSPTADERLLSLWCGKDFNDGIRLHCTMEIDVVKGFIRVS